MALQQSGTPCERYRYDSEGRRAVKAHLLPGRAGTTRRQVHFSLSDRTGSAVMELDINGGFISCEIYYPFGGTAAWKTRKGLLQTRAAAIPAKSVTSPGCCTTAGVITPPG
jgi:hypothetical protein